MDTWTPLRAISLDWDTLWWVEHCPMKQRRAVDMVGPDSKAVVAFGGRLKEYEERCARPSCANEMITTSFVVLLSVNPPGLSQAARLFLALAPNVLGLLIFSFCSVLQTRSSGCEVGSPPKLDVEVRQRIVNKTIWSTFFAEDRLVPENGTSISSTHDWSFSKALSQ